MQYGYKIREYIFEELIGTGGMGEVWKARHVHLQKSVAIKVLSSNHQNDQQFEARFLNEARAQAKLNNPHILSVSEYFYEHGKAYLVTPFIEGRTLDSVLRTQPGPLPLPFALEIAAQVLGALEHAHQQNVIHRDVKPSNILLDQHGKAYLIDFGIALSANQERQTQIGMTLGTILYMSPEQVLHPQVLDYRTDIYSFGCVLYQMLTGHPPFESINGGESAEYAICYAHVNSFPAPLKALNPSLPFELETMVLRALAKNPAERWATCADLKNALQGMILPDTIPVKVSKPEPTRFSHRIWQVVAVICMCLTFLTSFGWGSTVLELQKARRELAYRYGFLTKAELEEKKRKDAEKALQEQIETRKKLASQNPVTYLGTKLSNINKDGLILNKNTFIFHQEEIRYIGYTVKIQNNLAGINSVQGKLGIKYRRPDGTLMKAVSSPADYTFLDTVEITDSKEFSDHSLGLPEGGFYTPGTYTIEFFWDGKKIGEQYFLVY